MTSASILPGTASISSILFAFLLFALPVQSQSLFVKVNSGDCINCVMGIQYLEKIDTSLHPMLVFPKSEKRLAAKYVAELFPIPWNPAHIICDDSLYYQTLHSTPISSCHVLDKNMRPVFSCPLGELANFVDAINAHVYSVDDDASVRAFSLPDSIVLSKSLQKTTDKSRWVILDKTFNIIYKINKNNNIISALKPADIFSPDSLYRLFTGKDPKGVTEHITTLKKIKKWYPALNALYQKGDTLAVLCTYYTPIVSKTKKSIEVEKNYFLSLFSMEGALLDFYPMVWDEKMLEDYDVDEVSPFFSYGGKWFFPVFKEKKGDKNYSFVACKIENKRLIFNGFHPHTLPDKVMRKDIELIYEVASAVISGDKVFFKYFDFWFDMKDGVNKDTPLNRENNFKKDDPVIVSALMDVYTENRLSIALVLENERYECRIFDRHMQELKRFDVGIDVKTVLSKPAFDGASLYWIDTDYRINSKKIRR